MSIEINITPGVSLLRHLGNTEIKGWQCVAELIDNSIDGLVENKHEKDKIIDVYIPSTNEVKTGSVPLKIEDNGKGMSVEDLENALTAGMSGKEAVSSSLGLFGLGFNIATSRLGDKVVIRTALEDMNFELEAVIDLIDLKAKTRTDKTTRILVDKKPKTFKKSGTIIEVSRFHPRSKNLLNRRVISDALNRAYSSSLFDKYGILLRINKKEINPYKFCIWNIDRSVPMPGDKIKRIPVYYDFDGEIIDKAYFSKKFNTYIDAETAASLEKSEVVEKEIRIDGWVGIQRYLDPINYGINVIRNGRIILNLEKDIFFKWHNLDEIDPDIIMNHTQYWRGSYLEEYPIDNKVLGGRIVGEIHANFIHPNYSKDGLENKTDAYWLKVVKFLKGSGPFQPELNKALDYEENTSPLSMLFQGFRKPNPAGYKHLIGGIDSKNPSHAKARSMADFFYAGEKEYQDDTKWYEMVEIAEIGMDPDEEGDDPRIQRK